MIVHLFQCSSGATYCITDERSGEKIPEDCCRGSWRYVKDVVLERQDQRTAIDSDEAIADIETYGYHLVSGWYQPL